MINKLTTDLVNTQDSAACSTVSSSPEVCRAAFTKEGDAFADNNIRYVSPGFDMRDKAMFELQMYDCFSEVLKVTEAERRIEAKTRAYEKQLREEIGLGKRDVRQFHKPHEGRWTKDQKDSTTILFGGLTLAHEELAADAMRGLGYNMRPLPCPDNDSLTVGKEYGNRGQCNPTYYTVGNLVKYLQDLKEAGKEDIEDRYVFVTAGTCGPCRFGMYESEYRKALRDSGFDKFRVLLFQQTGGLNQTGDGEYALELNAKFGITLLKSIMVADMINELGCKIRPYEVNSGQTDEVIEDAEKVMGDALREGKSVFRALRKVRKMFKAIPADFTRVKPKVKITGEFWAQTTEGAGNYHMFRWLESEGAEVMVEPIGTWIEYPDFGPPSRAPKTS